MGLGLYCLVWFSIVLWVYGFLKPLSGFWVWVYITLFGFLLYSGFCFADVCSSFLFDIGGLLYVGFPVFFLFFYWMISTVCVSCEISESFLLFPYLFGFLDPKYLLVFLI